MSQSTIEHVELNGTTLFFSINDDQRDKPLLLYLHGGPGDACIPLTKKYNGELEDAFVFVNLDQRGAGLSYHRFSSMESLTIDVIVEDIYQFVLYLLERCQRKTLILMGHSWGTILGFLLIKQYPELFSHYVGIGQVVNMKKNIHLQQDFLATKLKRIPKINTLNVEKEPIATSLSLTKKIVSIGGSIYGAKNYRQLITPFLLSKDYSLRQLIQRLQGSNQAIRLFWAPLLTIDFESWQQFNVPLLFCEGKHDYHVSSALLAEYVTTIKSHTDIIWFENSAHFPQWEESTAFNRQLIAFFTD